MRYDSDVLYRPPGEWKSYLLQCTIGCSYNKCTFCAMYKGKQFRIRPVEEILEDIDMARDYYGPGLRRVFLMDGDAVIMKTEDLLRILHKLYRTFPSLEKVTTYAGPRSTLAKSPEELRAIREAGLNRAYLGVESGSDAGRFQVCTPDQILEECRLLIEHLDVDPLHFTSNHASNYLPLKGGLPEDREKFLSLLDEALAGKIRLRKTLNRGI